MLAWNISARVIWGLMFHHGNNLANTPFGAADVPDISTQEHLDMGIFRHKEFRTQEHFGMGTYQHMDISAQ